MTEPKEEAHWIPVPDPTKLTTEAVEKATEGYRRELASLREIIETRLRGMDEDRAHLWDGLNTVPPTLETRLERRRREFLDDLNGAVKVLEQRLTGMDTAIKLAADELVARRVSYPVEVETERQRIRADTAERLGAEREYIAGQIENVRTWAQEKFGAVDGRFDASKVAVDAALAAQKEAAAAQNTANSAAIAVSETNTKEQLTSLKSLTEVGQKAADSKIDDARTRITALESRTEGISQGSGQAREVRGEQREEQATRHAQVGVTFQAIMAVLVGLSVLLGAVALMVSLVKH